MGMGEIMEAVRGLYGGRSGDRVLSGL